MKAEKQDVLRGAAALFIERGYTRTSMRDIAEKCKYSKATLYQMFRSKEELGIAVSVSHRADGRKSGIDYGAGGIVPAGNFEKEFAREDGAVQREGTAPGRSAGFPRGNKESSICRHLQKQTSSVRLFTSVMMRTFGMGSDDGGRTDLCSERFDEGEYGGRRGRAEPGTGRGLRFYYRLAGGSDGTTQGKERMISQQQMRTFKEIAGGEVASYSASAKEAGPQSLKGAIGDYDEKRGSFQSAGGVGSD